MKSQVLIVLTVPMMECGIWNMSMWIFMRDYVRPLWFILDEGSILHKAMDSTLGLIIIITFFSTHSVPLITKLEIYNVTVCTWSHHVHLWKGGWLECLLWHSAQSNYLYSGNQMHVQTFLPKVDITSSGCHVVTNQCCGAFGWWHSCHNYIRIGGYKMMNAWAEGVPSSDILGVDLIGLK